MNGDFLLQVRTTPEHAWTWLRDTFSSSVLGTTSAKPPAGLGGGMSRPARLAVTTAALAVALGAAMLTGAPAFFFPALMIAGLFGGAAMGSGAFLLVLVLSHYVFGPAIHFWTFAAAAALQTALAMFLRVLFRESRCWGVRYRRLLSAMSQAVTVSDGEGRIGRPHPELGRLIGMPWPDHRGRRWLASVHPDDHKLITPSAPFKTVTVQRAELRLKNPDTGEWRWHLMRAVPLLGDGGEVEEWISILTDIHDRKLAEEQREVMIGEARHRLKNLITIIESLAKSSRPAEKDAAVDGFLARFLGRLHALSTAGDLALASNYATMQAKDVARATLAPFLEKDSRRLIIEGPKLELSEATGGALALGLNEMATNAIKYGALSVPEGRVAFTWSVEPQADGDLVTMEWRESGGPPPKAPEKEGYGARVIRFIPSRERAGTVAFDYAPEGYRCRVTFKTAKPRTRSPAEE